MTAMNSGGSWRETTLRRRYLGGGTGRKKQHMTGRGIRSGAGREDIQEAEREAAFQRCGLE
jgi:hypothetical protein